MKHAVLAMWDSADDRQKAKWVKVGEYHLRHVLWHERHTPGFREMITRLVREPDDDGSFNFLADARAALLADAFVAPPVRHRPRPDYLRVVQAQAGGD